MTTPKKTIQFYRKAVYGRSLDYIVDAGDAALIHAIIGSKTILASQREMLRDLTGGYLQWEQVLEPETKS